MMRSQLAWLFDRHHHESQRMTTHPEQHSPGRSRTLLIAVFVALTLTVAAIPLLVATVTG